MFYLKLFILPILFLYSFTIKADSAYNPSYKEFTLDKNVSKNFEKVVNNLQFDPYNDPYNYYIIAGKELEKLLPNDVKDAIRKMSYNEGPDLIIIHNFPIDTFIPETPKNGLRPHVVKSMSTSSNIDHIKNQNAKGFVSEIAMLGVGYLLNSEPFHIKEEAVISQVTPLTDSPRSWKTELLPHTEKAYDSYPIRYLSLVGLGKTSSAATNIIFFKDVIYYISKYYPRKMEWLMNTITKPLFLMSPGSSKIDKSEYLRPIIELKGQQGTILRLNLNPGRVIGVTKDAKEAISFLHKIIVSNEFRRNYYKKVYLHRGDYILFRNWKVMHSRDPFEINKKDWRWLQRCYFKSKK